MNRDGGNDKKKIETSACTKAAKSASEETTRFVSTLSHEQQGLITIDEDFESLRLTIFISILDRPGRPVAR
jgi:hypothetical protein